MTNIKIFYHVYCNNNTKSIFLDQVKKIIWSGLYNKSYKIYCFLAGEEKMVKIISDIISNLGSKFTIAKIGIDDTSFERFTLLNIKEFIEKEDKILYIHTKGVMRHNVNPEYTEAVEHWRDFMEYFLIYKHHDCIQLLDNYDTVGVNQSENIHYGVPKHYSGNFWWCKAEYYQLLDDFISYHDPCNTEFYICSKSPNMYNITHNQNASHGSIAYYNQYIDST